MSSITPLYPSPVYQADPLTGQQVQLYRDPQTGASLYQLPTEDQLLAQQAAAQAQSASQAQSTPAPTQAPAAEPTALYPSPEIEIDPATGRTILLYRDQQTGEATYQVPTQAQLHAYEHAAAVSQPTAPHGPTT